MVKIFIFQTLASQEINDKIGFSRLQNELDERDQRADHVTQERLHQDFMQQVSQQRAQEARWKLGQALSDQV